MKVLRTCLLLAPLGLGACAPQVPIPETYPTSFQLRMQAAHHWDALAAKVAQRLQEALGNRDAKGQPLVLNVQQPPEATVFNRAFHELLLTQLMQQGFGVSTEPNVGLPVSYEVQVITHKNRDLTPSLAGTGSAAASEIGFNNRSFPEDSGEPGYGSEPVYYAAGPIPDDEVIVTTSVLGGQRFITRMSDIRYISDANRDQYMGRTPIPTRRMEVVGP